MHTHTPEDLPFSYRVINVSPAPSSSWTTRETAQAQLESVTPLVGWVVVVGEFLHLTTILPKCLFLTGRSSLDCPTVTMATVFLAIFCSAGASLPEYWPLTST